MFLLLTTQLNIKVRTLNDALVRSSFVGTTKCSWKNDLKIRFVEFLNSAAQFC